MAEREGQELLGSPVLRVFPVELAPQPDFCTLGESQG